MSLIRSSADIRKSLVASLIEGPFDDTTPKSIADKNGNGIRGWDGIRGEISHSPGGSSDIGVGRFGNIHTALSGKVTSDAPFQTNTNKLSAVCSLAQQSLPSYHQMRCPRSATPVVSHQNSYETFWLLRLHKFSVVLRNSLTII